MFELQFLSLFSRANFIFDIYYSTHTQEKDWQNFPFHFLIAFSEETFGRYVTGDYKLGLWSLSLKSYFGFKKHSSHAVIVSLTRTHYFCYANEMNILRAFLCGCFFRTIDEIFAKQYNNDSNLFTHAQIRSTLFLKILNDIVVRWYSSTERWWIACVSWNWGKSSCQDDFMDNLEDLNNC